MSNAIQIHNVNEDAAVRAADKLVAELGQKVAALETDLRELIQARRDVDQAGKQADVAAVLEGRDPLEVASDIGRECDAAVSDLERALGVARSAHAEACRRRAAAVDRATRVELAKIKGEHGPRLFKVWRESIERQLDVAAEFGELTAAVREANLPVSARVKPPAVDALPLKRFLELGWVDRPTAERLRRDWLARGAKVQSLTMTPEPPLRQDLSNYLRGPKDPEAEQVAMLRRRYPGRKAKAGGAS